jgi:arylsulfatase
MTPGRVVWFGLALAALAGAPSRAAEPARKPNIVIVMPDDVGYGDFSINGSPIVRTPHIDALARQGVRFTDFHVSPTCSPTRAALMTGRHEFRSGVSHTIYERERLSLKATTLAQVLKSAGYATGIFGKWHLGDEPAYQPEKRGFDEAYIHGGGGIGQAFPGSCGDAPGNLYQDPALLHNGTFEKTHGYCTDLFFGQALRWIDAHRRGPAPFFAYITPNAAHAPLQCPESYAKRHAGAVADDVAKFYGMIENIDDNVGRLTAALHDWGLDHNTLVVFLTDNGGTFGVEIFNAGMRGKKVTPYQGGTRVPSFWRWPAGFAGGSDVPALTAHIDILPTLAEIAGVPLEGPLREQVEGRSLLPLLKDPKAPWPDRTLVTHVGRWPRGRVADWKHRDCSIRDARFTLVNNAELYDLKVDPGEKTNVIADHPAEVVRLRAAYDAWWDGTLPKLDNEDAVGPRVNPFKARYWDQFGGGPDAALLDQMNPDPSRWAPTKKAAARQERP